MRTNNIHTNNLIDIINKANTLYELTDNNIDKLYYMIEDKYNSFKEKVIKKAIDVVVKYTKIYKPNTTDWIEDKIIYESFTNTKAIAKIKFEVAENGDLSSANFIIYNEKENLESDNMIKDDFENNLFCKIYNTGRGGKIVISNDNNPNGKYNHWDYLELEIIDFVAGSINTFADVPQSERFEMLSRIYYALNVMESYITMYNIDINNKDDFNKNLNSNQLNLVSSIIRLYEDVTRQIRFVTGDIHQFENLCEDVSNIMSSNYMDNVDLLINQIDDETERLDISFFHEICNDVREIAIYKQDDKYHLIIKNNDITAIELVYKKYKYCIVKDLVANNDVTKSLMIWEEIFNYIMSIDLYHEISEDDYDTGFSNHNPDVNEDDVDMYDEDDNDEYYEE